MALYPVAWPLFLQRCGAALSDEMLRIGECLSDQIAAMLDRFRDRPRTLCHGDYRLDNLFFGIRPDHEPIRVVDWQIVSQCVGTYDVGMFLSQSVAPSIRREIELDLLRAYHDRLLEHGVRGYTFADCIDDYRWTLLIGMGSRRRSASQAIDLPSDGGVNLERLFTNFATHWNLHRSPPDQRFASVLKRLIGLPSGSRNSIERLPQGMSLGCCNQSVTNASMRIPVKATTLSGAWRPRDPVDDDQGGARA